MSIMSSPSGTPGTPFFFVGFAFVAVTLPAFETRLRLNVYIRSSDYVDSLSLLPAYDE